MDVFRLEATKNTPEVLFKPDGHLKMRGRSIHEDAVKFFAPLLNWVEDYVESPPDFTTVDIQLEYFNSASAKFILNILQDLVKVIVAGRKLVINWYYEEGDDDILERGEYFASILNLDFNFIEIG